MPLRRMVSGLSAYSSTSLLEETNKTTDPDFLDDDNASLETVHIRECRGSAELDRRKSVSAELDQPSQRYNVCELARDQYREDFASSAIQDLSENFPRFAEAEIVRGAELGHGAFGAVHQVDGFPIPELNYRATTRRLSIWRRKKESSARQMVIPPELHLALCSEISDEEKEGGDAILPDPYASNLRDMMANFEEPVDQTESRKFIAQNCWRDSGETRYAIKKLKEEIVADPDLLFQGILDLSLETRILSSLPHHPNMIKLRAISKGDRFDPSYFIVLDRLYDTLETRLEKWRQGARIKPKRNWLSLCLPSSRRHQEKVKELLSSSLHSTATEEDVGNLKQRQQQTIDRLWKGFDLASALAHLHRNNIMHRDLKPDNIGFDIRGDIRIFDLGLAKEIPAHDGPWKLTAMCGSPRYMAPEVALGLSYDAKCDVYSLALLLWELLNLKKPFGKVTMDKLRRLVWDERTERRPRIQVVPEELDQDQQSSLFLTSPKASWTPALKQLVERAWSHDFSKRPTMPEMEKELKAELTKGIERMDNAHGGLDSYFLDSKRMSHKRRRSTFVYQSTLQEEDPISGHPSSPRGAQRRKSGVHDAQAKVLAWFGGASSQRLFSSRSLLNVRGGKSPQNFGSNTEQTPRLPDLTEEQS